MLWDSVYIHPGIPGIGVYPCQGVYHAGISSWCIGHLAGYISDRIPVLTCLLVVVVLPRHRSNSIHERCKFNKFSPICQAGFGELTTDNLLAVHHYICDYEVVVVCVFDVFVFFGFHNFTLLPLQSQLNIQVQQEIL